MTETCTGNCQILRGCEQLDDWDGECGGGINFIEELIVETKRNGLLKSLFYVLDNGKTVDCVNGNKHSRLKMNLAIHQLMAQELVKMEIFGLENRVKLHCNGRRNLSVAEFLACFGIRYRIYEMNESEENGGEEECGGNGDEGEEECGKNGGEQENDD